MRLRGLLVDLLLLLPWGRGRERYRRRKRRRYAARHLHVPSRETSAAEDGPLRFPVSASPRVSIVIASYGNLPRAMDCLRSIARHPPAVDFEVIVLDDCSGDPAMAELERVEGLRFMRNAANLGYLRTVNAAARQARGELLWLLNDDTLVTAGAADALVDTLDRLPAASAVGSLLLNPDGSVQEAGSIVRQDGTADSNCGTDPLDSANRYRHEADFCSAASLMLRRADFEALGGYDEMFAPAYYEDTDLAFRLRAAGGAVVVQPASKVVHLGGGSHGHSQAMRLIERNRLTFVQKWRTVLVADHFDPDHDSFAARDRVGGREAVLVLCRGDEGAEAALRLAAGDCIVKLWSEDRHAAAQMADRLGALGIEVVSANGEETLPRWLSQHAVALTSMLIAGSATPSDRCRWEGLAARHRVPLSPGRSPASGGPDASAAG
jgi:GT2 family glycosyltransferase